jgi:hypothetical protein
MRHAVGGPFRARNDPRLFTVRAVVLPGMQTAALPSSCARHVVRRLLTLFDSSKNKLQPTRSEKRAACMHHLIRRHNILGSLRRKC